MKYRTVAHITEAEALEMGHTIVKQPLPTQRVERIDPFLLLHHFGPYDVEPGHDPLDVGPHPHRGFEPVTFLYQGSIRHRDSRNNTGHLDAGDVQWMTAGRGIIHSERASREFRENGGILEGIQLWINLPKAHKMVQPRYQDIKAADLPAVQLPNEGGRIRVVAGAYGDLQGAAQTHTPMVALQAHLKAGGQAEIPLPESHNALIYIVKGEVRVNGTWTYSTHQLLHFRLDGEGIALAGVAPESEVLVLSGEPIGEPVTQWGPYVMTTQTEIMEAMRDYQMGKMGFYTEY